MERFPTIFILGSYQIYKLFNELSQNIQITSRRCFMSRSSTCRETLHVLHGLQAKLHGETHGSDRRKNEFELFDLLERYLDVVGAIHALLPNLPKCTAEVLRNGFHAHHVDLLRPYGIWR
jgi:hypothetical protein